MSFMDLMPSAEELRDLLMRHDFAVRQIILLDGYIERLSEQTFVSAIGNRLAVAFQKMIRITVAEGLKRMYKEYRLKQWQTLLDKAATLRRLLEQQERPQVTENQPTIEQTTGSDLRFHETQHDWQRVAPEAYDWHPVTDYRTRADSSGARNQVMTFRDQDTSVPLNGATDSDRFPTMVPLTNLSHAQVTMDFDPTESSVTEMSVQQTLFPEQQQEGTVTENQSTINRLHPDINEMVEAMEAIFQDSDDDFDDYYQLFPDPQQNDSETALQNLTSPIPRPQWNLASSPLRAASHNMTSSPAGAGRALEGINQTGMLGEIMNENSPARRRLLWRDPPTPTNDPPVLLAISNPIYNSHPRPEEGRPEPTNPGNAPEARQEATEDTNPQDQQDADLELDSSFQSDVSWDSSVDSNDIESLGGILFAAERLAPMNQSMHMDVEMGDMGLGHLLFDRAAGTWATSHCEFHRVN